jgi:hypothetical protein
MTDYMIAENLTWWHKKKVDYPYRAQAPRGSIDPKDVPYPCLSSPVSNETAYWGFKSAGDLENFLFAQPQASRLDNDA